MMYILGIITGILVSVLVEIVAFIVIASFYKKNNYELPNFVQDVLRQPAQIIHVKPQEDREVEEFINNNSSKGIGTKLDDL